MPLYNQESGFDFLLPNPPQRIISLVPSQTELLYDLGLDKEVAGITKFCIHPASWHQQKKRVGGTKQINKQVIEQLQPDLIIANKEENDRNDIEWLAEKYPVWVTDIKNLEDALVMITTIGRMVNRSDAAKEIQAQIVKSFNAISQTIPQAYSPPTAAYLIWKSPCMCAGGDTFINSMLQHCGIKNVFENLCRYPEISMDQLQQAKPQFLLLSSEPFPFQEKHIDIFRQQLTDTSILLVNGEMFSWYGSRLLKAPSYFLSLMYNMGIAPKPHFQIPKHKP